MEALKKQHFSAFSQKCYFALVHINSQKFAHLKKWKKKYKFWIFLEGASSTLNNVLSMLNNVLSTLNNVVFPSIFNCGDLYCNCGHLSSRPGQDAKKSPLWVKKHPFYKGCLRNVRGSLGQEDIGLNGTCNKPGVLDAQFFTSRSFIVMKHRLYKWHQLPPRPEMLSECFSQRQATPGNTHSCRGISHQSSFLRIESQDCSRTETEVGIGLQ